MKTSDSKSNTNSTKHVSCSYSYWDYSSERWMANKSRNINKNGNKGSYYYTCKTEGCKNPRVLNKKNDPDYKFNIYNKFCTKCAKNEE